MTKHAAEVPDAEQRGRFVRALLDDLEALEQMIEGRLLETGIHRIGAEQEMFLVERGLDPAPAAPELLDDLAHPRLTTELARFNLEANLTARRFGGSCLSEMHRELDAIVEAVRTASAARDVDVLLTGILPTLRQGHLSSDNMAPVTRYAELDRAVRDQRGDSFRVRIKGVDELDVVHDNVMLESCNTSFQLHFQVGPDEFAKFYNAAQLATAPVLACAANSPVLLRHRLWAESRIALFPESVDDRASGQRQRGDAPRVFFGNDWLRGSVLDLLREDVSRCHVLLTAGDDAGDSMARLRRGELPALDTLCLFNGTVYRWNRPCYGVADGRAHLRIENRALPAGPSPTDEIANAAFFYGMLAAIARQHPRLADEMSFDEVHRNFVRAARLGLDAQLTWLDGATRPIEELVLETLLPLARTGLLGAGVDASDVDRYLAVIGERVSRRCSGASWILDSLAAMESHGHEDLRYRSVTAAMLSHQFGGSPVHEWPLAAITDDETCLHASFRTVGQVMSKAPLTVRPDDVIDLAASLMEWERARFVAVEEDDGSYAGLITPWSLLSAVTRSPSAPESLLVRDVMDTAEVVVVRESSIGEAIELMKKQRIGCLPVVENDVLLGLLTHEDLIEPLHGAWSARREARGGRL